ncbi:hypothetical protein MPSI1_001124 [Malassezia psittaci]|uniref:Uncharacterized protein n=1 Tax=Malassezia psittaci TaxID=1821823 RepID=A0AAF0JDK1_9BASI|nr:hypothetical protein MPSI1_001124 [Malassezia psittaci]
MDKSDGQVGSVEEPQVVWETGRVDQCPATVSGRKHANLVVELPLLSPSFIPQKKGYERAWKCLSAWDRARAQHASDSKRAAWPFLFVWTPPFSLEEDDYKGGSIQFPSDLVPLEMVRPCSLNITSDILNDVWVPQLLIPRKALEKSERITLFDQQTSFLEYTGLASVASPRVRTYDRCDSSIAFYSVPEPCVPGLLHRIRIRGMLPSSLVTAIVKILQGVSGTSSGSLKKRSTRPPWAYVSVIGFPDTPIAWRTREPGLGLGLGSGKSIHQMASETTTASLHQSRKKGVLRRGESEHGFLRTGENGWSAFMLAPEQEAFVEGTLFIESLELDTYN